MVPLAGRNSALNRPDVRPATPDTVYSQIMEFYDRVSGFGHLIMVGKTGFITDDEAVKNITLVSKEALPRLRELRPPATK